MRNLFIPPNVSRGRLLVLSGLDGSGKSTQAGLLAKRLRTEGYDVATVWSRWEPALSAPLIRLAKRRLDTRADAATADYRRFTTAKRRTMQSRWKRTLWQLMVWSEYAAQINRRLLPHVIRRRGVICDRYVYDTLIDIAVNFSVKPGEIETLCHHPLLALFPAPRQAIYIDIDPETGASRKADGTPPEYLADRREYYRSMARLLGAATIDGGRGVEEVAEAIWSSTGAWRRSLRRATRKTATGDTR
jgi:thymidylate kinase